MRKHTLKYIVVLSSFLLAHWGVAENQQTTVSSYLTMHGEPDYQEGFKHWRYVNPNAPKGGKIRLATLSKFDNFNRHAHRGSSAPAIETLLFDTLMVSNEDEDSAVYGLLADTVEYPNDYSWAIFTLNKTATFADGKPVTADDVVFSFNKLMAEGVINYRRYFEGSTVEKIDRHTVRFTLPFKDLDHLFSLANLTVFPKHYYQDKDLSSPFDEPPFGSGPYRIGDYKMGTYVEYQRNENYWAKNHPTRLGTNNFDVVRYDVFLDETVKFEAFKKGLYDFLQENISKRWATLYTGKAFDTGAIQKKSIPHETPSPMQAYTFNVQKEHFKKREVREAISMLFDFEWSNKNLFFSSYKRRSTFFDFTKYRSAGLPEGKELEILKQYKNQLPDRLFTQPFELSKTKGNGNIRPQLRQALRLLKSAGYVMKNGKQVDSVTGQPLEFELLTVTPSSERVAIPFRENLAKAGITMNIRLVDTSRYINRMRERDYDMVVGHLGGGSFPSSSLLFEWHSDYMAESSYNRTGAINDVLDALVEGVVENQKNEELLTAYGRALDRFLLWQHYAIPQYYSPDFRIAYWDKFDSPDQMPKLGIGVDSWWFNKGKADKLKKNKAK